MREQVVVTQVNITKAGQVKSFQIRLPKNTKRIIGIETGVRMIKVSPIRLIDEPIKFPGQLKGIYDAVLIPKIVSAENFNRNTLIGELKLQSCERANIFYATHIQTDENIGARDFSQTTKWQALPFTHQWKTEEDVVKVNGESTIVQGIYQDRIGEANKFDTEYIVNVYVWVEIEEAHKKKGEIV